MHCFGMRAVDGKQEIYLEWPNHKTQVICDKLSSQELTWQAYQISVLVSYTTSCATLKATKMPKVVEVLSNESKSRSVDCSQLGLRSKVNRTLLGLNLHDS